MADEWCIPSQSKCPDYRKDIVKHKKIVLLFGLAESDMEIEGKLWQVGLSLQMDEICHFSNKIK